MKRIKRRIQTRNQQLMRIKRNNKLRGILRMITTRNMTMKRMITQRRKLLRKLRLTRKARRVKMKM